MVGHQILQVLWEKVYWSGSIFTSAFLLAEVIATCSMIDEKACIHRRNFYLDKLGILEV